MKKAGTHKTPVYRVKNIKINVHLNIYPLFKRNTKLKIKIKIQQQQQRAITMENWECNT